MIKEIRYKNFKALRDATLPLGRFTLIVGANGTGKTTALKGIEYLKHKESFSFEDFVSVSQLNTATTEVSIAVSSNFGEQTTGWNVQKSMGNFRPLEIKAFPNFEVETKWLVEKQKLHQQFLDSFRMFSLEAQAIAESVTVRPKIDLKENGMGLAGVLDQLRDSDPEKFEELNSELNRWFYEFDRILFETPSDGVKSFLLRTTIGKHKIKAKDLSDGTLLALAYLTLAYLPNPPKIVAFEEPEKGIHPRLLRNIQEAMYRLAYPENYGEKREPIQVIATTHSPYLLDLYKDHPEEIVIAEKDENGVHFENLAKMKNIDKILRGGESLGEVWFTGVLGGVPAHI